MRLVLHDFQDDAVRRIHAAVRRAVDEARAGTPQAVVLAAPTGSGKTVMAAAAIERLFQDAKARSRRACILWLSDQPDINEQTRARIARASEDLPLSRLRVIDSGFSEMQLAARTVYFLNTQKLARDQPLVRAGDVRPETIWRILDREAHNPSVDVVLVVDEAHRGMRERSSGEQSIVQGFFSGRADMRPFPVILGITATPQRLQRYLAAGDRTVRQLAVHPHDVRRSGLLKDKINVFHAGTEHLSDFAILEEAARRWNGFGKSWLDYCTQERESIVTPILVVQVRDSAGPLLGATSTDLDRAIEAIERAAGALPDDAYVHSFQEGGLIQTARGRLIRYLRPQDINPDPAVRVVFFKANLSTGWDCPRAEVMMSFRVASDATAIAQLVGRIVRTPLARRIEENTSLNAVALFVPYFDAAEISRLIAYLSGLDFAGEVSVAPSKGGDREVLTFRSSGETSKAREALEQLTSYTIPSSARVSPVKRLVKLAALLVASGSRVDALDVVRSRSFTVMEELRLGLLEEMNGAISELLIDSVTVGGGLTDTGRVTISVTDNDLDASIRMLDAELAPGLLQGYWRWLVREHGMEIRAAKIAAVRAGGAEAVHASLNASAAELLAAWIPEAAAQSVNWSERGRSELRQLQEAEGNPAVSFFRLPDMVDAELDADTAIGGSLYVDDQGLYPIKGSSWEADACVRLSRREGFVAFYRNQVRGSGGLCIPYNLDGTWHGFYPDVLAVRKKNGSCVVDIAEPHRSDWRDWLAKARALSDYAESVAHLGRVEMIAEIAEKKLSLRLDKANIRNALRSAQGFDEIVPLMETWI